MNKNGKIRQILNSLATTAERIEMPAIIRQQDFFKGHPVCRHDPSMKVIISQVWDAGECGIIRVADQNPDTAMPVILK